MKTGKTKVWNGNITKKNDDREIQLRIRENTAREKHS
jgi:hypothetical protein